MKKLIIIILGLFLILSAMAQDRYTQFRYDFMNIKVSPVVKINFGNPVLKPALILLATFVINQAIIIHDEKHNFHNTSKKTGIIFLIGGAACTLTYAFEMKKFKKSL